jgi:hypothetical protein
VFEALNVRESMNQLTVTIDLEEYSAGLSGVFEADGFKGFGEGWFNLSDIKEFCDSFEKLANTLDGETELVAGQSKTDGSEYLERFGLRCYVVARTGILGVHVTLSEYPYTDCRPQEISKVSGELKVEIQSVINFVQGLRSLCSGGSKEVSLVGRQ